MNWGVGEWLRFGTVVGAAAGGVIAVAAIGVALRTEAGRELLIAWGLKLANIALGKVEEWLCAQKATGAGTAGSGQGERQTRGVGLLIRLEAVRRARKLIGDLR